MKLTRTIAPAAEPITLTQAREWCAFQAGVTADDALLTSLITEVRAYLESKLTGRKLINQTWTVSLDEAEVGSVITLPLLPLSSVTSIATYDDAGDATTVDPSNYQVRTGEAPRIVLSPSGEWPTMREFDSMLITCVIGYGAAAANLPEEIVMLMKGLVQHQYRSKGMGITETASGQLIGVPGIYAQMIQSLRVEPWA
jgi:uncharacterized phiE125 gp8 family phage protein